MKKSYIALVMGVLGLAGNAGANESIGFIVSLGSSTPYHGPTYYGPHPGHAAPQGIHYAPPPVAYYRPAPVHYGPRAFIGYNNGPHRHFVRHDNGLHRGWHGHSGHR